MIALAQSFHDHKYHFDRNAYLASFGKDNSYINSFIQARGLSHTTQGQSNDSQNHKCRVKDMFKQYIQEQEESINKTLKNMR